MIAAIYARKSASSGANVFVSTEMFYHELADVRETTADMDDRTDADALLLMIETYDPSKQAVVTVAVGEGNPISVKMRFDEPYIDE